MVWLDKKTKEAVLKNLSHILADTFVVYVKTLNFHWNMVGSQFFMYHKLLEDLYKEMAEGIDELAERMRMLGGKAPGSLQAFQELSCVPEAKNTLSQDEMVKDLVKSLESLVEHCHEAVAHCDDVKDQGTSDLLIDRLREFDKAAWLLRSHFKG